MDNLYIFETRRLNYLDAYAAKAKTLHYNPVIISGHSLEGNKKLIEFKKHYQHLSINDYNFEFNCFARYFALANEVVDNNSFILSDSDIYLVGRNISLAEQSKTSFIGSEGFYNGVSEWQISPHFSIWNKELVTNFVDYLISAYKRNQDDHFLKKHYEVQKGRLGHTAISDMTLLYLWINDNKIPFINSNSTNNDWGIDHNISSFCCANAQYQTIHNRKKLEVTSSGGVDYILESGERQAMSCLHFQGAYKPILYDFYLGKYIKFEQFSVNINIDNKAHQLAKGKKVKPFKKAAAGIVDAETALDYYRNQIDLIPDAQFIETPPGGGWSYAEVYSHIMQATLASAVAMERCATGTAKPTNKKTNLLGKLVLLFGRFPPVRIKQPKSVAAKMPALKITKEEARNLIIKCRQKLDSVAGMINHKKESGRASHPRLGMLNDAQWLRFIGIHLKHHLKQLQRIENKFAA